MMKLKGLLSTLALLVFAGATVASSTGAFFSDSETSTGNRFTAGALDLLVDSQSHYNGMVCTEVDDDVFEWQPEEGFEPGPGHHPEEGTACDGSWELTDLGPTFKFFNFADLKPGDSGENTISLHVEDNPAYVCAVIDNMEDNDLGLTEPEGEDGDNTDGPGNGELSSQIRFFAWSELDGDNVWEPANEEPMLFSNEEGPASDVIDGVSYPLFTPAPGGVGPTDPEVTNYIGLYWCYGDITVTPGAGTFAERLTCDGSAVNNITQSDQLLADFTFYAEQARHNEDFECPTEVVLPGDDDDDVEPPVVNEGAANMTAKFGARFRSFNNTGGEEVYVGKYDLGIGGNRVAQNLIWSKPGSHPVTMIYSTVADSLAVKVGANATTTYPNLLSGASCAPDEFDTMQIYARAQSGSSVALSDVMLDAFALGDFTGSTAGENFNVTGFDFSDGFALTGTIDLGGVFSSSQEASKVEILIGCSL